MYRGDWRTSKGQVFGLNAKRAPRASGGRVDPSLIVDMAEVRRRARKPEADPMMAEQAEMRAYADLIRAWQDAPKGADKREALAALRAYERRTDRVPFGQPEGLPDSAKVDVSTGAESWLEVK